MVNLATVIVTVAMIALVLITLPSHFTIKVLAWVIQRSKLS